MGRIVKLDELLTIVEMERANKKKIVFTNGCFDILHIGHISYLKTAKELGDILIVGINSDRSVKLLKGSNRPIINENERAAIVSSLYFVDYVIIFDESRPNNLINMIRPDIHVKGGDYKAESLPEYPIVTSYGGKVVICPYINNRSTSEIIKTILARFSK